MELIVNDHYILSLSDCKAQSVTINKLIRVVLNPAIPAVDGKKTVSVLELRSLMQMEDSKYFYNKTLEIKSALEHLYDRRLFKLVTYKDASFTFILGPDADKVCSPAGKHIYYDNKNFGALKTNYALSVYEMIQKALREDSSPSISIKKDDFPPGIRPKSMTGFYETMKRTAAQINKTDVTITEITFKTDAIVLKAGIK